MKLSRHQHGAALPAAALFAAVAAFMAVSYAQSIRQHAAEISAQAEHLETRLAARSGGVAAMAFILSQRRAGQETALWTQSLQIGRAQLRIQARNSAGLLDINLAPAKLLRLLAPALAQRRSNGASFTPNTQAPKSSTVWGAAKLNPSAAPEELIRQVSATAAPTILALRAAGAPTQDLLNALPQELRGYFSDKLTDVWRVDIAAEGPNQTRAYLRQTIAIAPKTERFWVLQSQWLSAQEAPL